MVKEEHCDRNSLLSVDTDDVAAHGAQSAQDGPQRLNNQQKQKVVGKNLNLVLLTTLVCVDSLTSRERGRKVGTGTIPSSPRKIKAVCGACTPSRYSRQKEALRAPRACRGM